MEPFIRTVRAIGTQLALRLYIPAAATLIVVMGGIIMAALWLTTLSNWWWLLFVPVTIAGSVALALAIIVLLLIRHIRPPQTKAQKQAVAEFVDKLQGTADIVGTPKVIILFRVIRSIAAPSKDHYLSDLAARKDLVSDFKHLQRQFTVES